MISDFSAKVTSLLGQNSKVVKALRPTYARCLNLLAGNYGLNWTVNHEPLRIDPSVRHLLPKVSEPILFNYLKANIKPGQTVLDVGAFLGTYAVFAARWVGPKGKVIAFEPTAANHPIIHKHLHFNNVANQVLLIESAVGKQRGVIEFCHYPEPYMNKIFDTGDSPEHTVVTKVPLITLDEACEELKIVPDWIRMDVQGYEFDVLRGAKDLIRAGRGRLQIVAEMHPQFWPQLGLNQIEANRILRGLGLRATPLESNDNPFEPDCHALLEYI